MKKILLIFGFIYLSLSNIAFGVDSYSVPVTAPYTYVFNVYNAGEDDSVYNLSQSHIMTVLQSAFDLKGILNVNPTNPATYSIKTISKYNAYALSPYVTVLGNDYKITRVNAVLNNKTITTPAEELAEYTYDGNISIGLGMLETDPGWQSYSKKQALYHEELPDLYSISKHEIIHTLGLCTAAGTYNYASGDNTYYFKKDENDHLSIHDYYLRIYKGDPAEAFVPANEIKPEDKNAINEEGFDIFNYSPYFVGENTLKVLSGEATAADAKNKIIEKGGLVNYSQMYVNEEDPEASEYKTVFGLPIHPSDDIKKGEVDLSHIELRNSFMSHQDFRNWLTLMEAELAYLKDIGYNIELRDYFGKSYYLNGNDVLEDYALGYSEWDGNEYTVNPSLIDNGVGIHIYSKHNNIRQITNDIYTAGNGAVGVRIDGEHNTYTLDSTANIITTGNDSLGIAATWGKDHVVNVSNGSTVSATGDNGIAVSFDFGSNMLGKVSCIKGSYINYDGEDKKDFSPELETQGALIETFNTAGTLTGSKAAIYISDNAYVKNININNNSVINGNIISEWNSTTSGNANVLRLNELNQWTPVNKDNIDEIYFTNLTFNGTTDVNGNIDGTNDIFNTLVMGNTGTLNFDGNELNVYTLNNTGTINFTNLLKPLEISSQNTQITGEGGVLNFDNGVNLSGYSFIENTVNVSDKFISLLDDSQNRLNLSKLNSDNANLYLDFGDKFILQNNSDEGLNTLNLKQIAVNEKNVDELVTTDKVKLFEEKDLINPAITLNVGSNTNFYYKNNKYNFSQDGTDKSYLKIVKTEGNYGLADAIADSTTANYIVDETDTFANLGTIQGNYFEISGDDIDLNGEYSGLVVDGTINSKTTLKTDIKGAADSNITLQNNANMLIDSKDDEITIAKQGEIAVSIDNSSLYIDAEKNKVTFNGDIIGFNTNTENKVILKGNEVNFNLVDNVVISTQANDTNLNNTSTNTIWQIAGGVLNISNDNYLSADGSNALISGGGTLNLANSVASDIYLSKLTLNDDLKTAIDIDLSTLQADKFVFNDQNDFLTNGNDLVLSVNFANNNTPLEGASYTIPFVSADYNNQNILAAVNYKDTTIMTPIFKYNMEYNEANNQGNFILSRGSSDDYRSYNPSILAPVYAAQLGGYFNQLSSYNMGFSNMDMTMLMTKEERTAMKYRNQFASSGGVLTYDPNQSMLEKKSLWFRPYTVFEKVNVSNGGTVENIGYGSYFGGDTEIIELRHGWDAQYSVYVGYNGSHQSYEGTSIYQNGGQLGVSGYFYKDNFFTGLTASVGASNAQSSTMYGHEDFTMLSTGIASKTGYNWELAKGKFIIQPNFLMSYSFVNTFDYTNAAGVKISSNPLNAIQIAPGIKFIGNLKNGWQPYIGISMIWNIMDKAKFRANNVSLPQMSIDPYIQYGVGIKRKWKDKFTGFAQAMMTNGGRTGISLTAGFSWSLGK